MDGVAVSVTHLTKKFGHVTAVEDLTFTAQPGRITGFLGPNGAGKSTTLRILASLVSPTSGEATIGGAPYAHLDRPAQVVGTHFAAAFHPGRSGLDHLRVFAPRAGATDARCHEVLAMVGMTDAAHRRVGGYSLGMRQRLGLATALLGDPQVLILDESANGLDPSGVRWLRAFLRDFAARGGTVLLSSHLLSEVEQTVDDVVIVARGRLRHWSSLADLRQMTAPAATLRSPDTTGLGTLATHYGQAAQRLDDHTITVAGISAAHLGAAAHAAGVEVHGLADEGASLEDVFLRLTTETGVAA